jgi:hypothetical protein
LFLVVGVSFGGRDPADAVSQQAEIREWSVAGDVPKTAQPQPRSYTFYVMEHEVPLGSHCTGVPTAAPSLPHEFLRAARFHRTAAEAIVEGQPLCVKPIGGPDKNVNKPESRYRAAVTIAD